MLKRCVRLVRERRSLTRSMSLIAKSERRAGLVSRYGGQRQITWSRSFCANSEEKKTEEVEGEDSGVVVPDRVYPGEGQPKEYSPKVQSIVDEIAGLDLLEVSELVDLLSERLNIPDVAFGVAGGASGDDGEEEEAAEEKAEQTEFAVKLKAFDAKSKIKLIKEVRSIGGFGLKEAKEIVESVPVVLKKDLSKEEAEAMQEKLKELGAETELE